MIDEKEDKRSKKLIKNTIIVAIGQICTKFVSFFLLPLYTAFLQSDEYGIVDLLNTIVALIIPIISLQLDQAVFRFLIDARNNEEKTKNIINTTIVAIIFQSIIFTLIFVFFSAFWKNDYKIFIILNVLVSMLASILLQISRGIGNNLLYSIGSIISGLGTIIFNVIFIVGIKLNAYGMLLGTFLGNFLCIVFLAFKLKLIKMINLKKIDKSILKKLSSYSVPLIPNAISWWIVNASDRIIVSKFLGLEENGIYSAAYKFSNICITIFNVFSLTWTEVAALHFNDEDKDLFYTNIFKKTLKFFCCICLWIISIMPITFNLLIRGESYAEAFYQIPILLIATIFNIVVSMYGSIYVATKNSKEIAKTSIYAAVINIFINLILIKYIGLYAASISTLIAYLSMSIYRVWDSKKYITIKWNIKFISVFSIFTIITLFGYYGKNEITQYWIFIFVTTFSIVSNLDIIGEIAFGLKNKVKGLANDRKK